MGVAVFSGDGSVSRDQILMFKKKKKCFALMVEPTRYGNPTASSY